MSARIRSTAVATEQQLATLAKALAHPARIRIIRLLLARQACIGCEIVDEVGLAQSTTSEHLRILKAAGIIAGEIEGPRVCYSLNPWIVQPLAALLADVMRFGSDVRAAGVPARRARRAAARR